MPHILLHILKVLRKRLKGESKSLVNRCKSLIEFMIVELKKELLNNVFSDKFT